MFRDPDTTWPGGFPYAILAPAGVTPNSTRSQMMKAAFYFMQEGNLEEAEKALRAVRTPEERLVVDFFLYLGPVNPEQNQETRDDQ
jgi:hypothetical protein